MAKKFYTDIDMNEQELRNFSLEKLAADPSGGGLYTGRKWYNTTESVAKYYDGTAVQIYAARTWVTSEINKLQRSQGSFDASPGSLPTSANKTQGDLTQIVSGDYWFISVAGTIAGIGGADELSPGDKLQYMGGGAGTAANWVGIQTNLNDDKIGDIKGEKQTVSLVANTPLAVNASTLANIHSIQIYDSAGAEIVIDVEKLGGNNQRTLTSKKSLTNIVVEMTGTR